MKGDGSPSFPATNEDLNAPAFDLVILFSGGADSILMLELSRFLKLRPMCIIIDYQQLHFQEIDFAKRYLTANAIPFRIVKLHDLQIQSGLTGSGIKARFEGVHEMHVPSRNLMFVGIAASIAEDLEVDTIWYGADYSDYVNKFPDCMQEWFGKVNEVLEINGPHPIKLEAPLAGMSKESILKALVNLGIKEKDIFSGYGGL